MLPGVTDVTTAFSAVGVFFQPERVQPAPDQRRHHAVAEWVRTALATASVRDERRVKNRRLPVCFDEAFAPDLPLVAKQAGVSVDEVVRQCCSVEYTVGAVGFAPGFAYLEGLPELLQTARRSRPRTRVPAGAVAIGGPYTAVYPNASPGGWNLIGQCPERLFDPHADPPGVLQAGDRVRFEPIEPDQLPSGSVVVVSPAPPQQGRAVLKIISPGVQSSLQAPPRAGARQWGVSAGGAMDPAALRVANELIGNPADAVALEATLVGPVIECLHDCVLGIAGGVPEALGGARRVTLRAGQRLDLRGLTGARAYLSAPGGFAAECVLGGAGTDLQAGFGGFAGRALAAGDELLCEGPLAVDTGDSGWFLPLSRSGDATLRIVRYNGPGAVDDHAWRRLLTAEFRVASESNRMGVRLAGEAITAAAPAAGESRPVAPGVVQLPPGGEPIVLGVDCQTLGGYPIAGCVVAADFPILAQLRPAELVRFAEISLEDAEQWRQRSDSELSAVLAGVREAVRRR